MRISYIVLTTLALAACGKDKEGSGDEESDVTDPNECAITAEPTYPANGAVDAYYRGAIEFELSDADDAATISVADASGADVAGTVSRIEDNKTIYFTPSAALSPSTSYTSTLTWCDGETAEATFTTSSLGEPLTADITGKTYVVDLASGNFVEPAGVGELIGSLLTQSVLLGVVSSEPTAEGLVIRGALSGEDGLTQDTCTQTLEDFPAADFTQSPYFEIPEGDVPLNVAGYEITINSMSISGTFAADGSYFGGGVLKGELDARDIGPLLKDQLEDTSPEYVCDLLLGFGVSCIPCSSDNEPVCARIHVNQLTAELTSGTLIEVAETECHESCADSCTNKECAEADTFPVCM
jgi:hypothetical protein